jgi:hypothetical protein
MKRPPMESDDNASLSRVSSSDQSGRPPADDAAFEVIFVNSGEGRGTIHDRTGLPSASAERA